ncbi:MAG: DUF4838 domain-containing protein [Abditibacteriaceae bacterium]
MLNRSRFAFVLSGALALLITSGCLQAAPKIVQRAPENVTGAVLINAITRNRIESKISLQLAEDGKALLPIVISEKASASTQAVAKELADYLSRISGATFEVKTGDGTTGIVLGTMADFPTPALDKALQIVNGFDGVEAYAIRTREKKVLLLGATDLGASHAAFRFLDELGYRHFFPNSAWEVVPKIPDLKWHLDITDRPQILVRSIWFEAGSGTAQAEKDYQNWKRHNAEAASFGVNISGGGMAAPFTKEILAAHPEYEPLLKQADGTFKRQWDGSWQPELGNPGARKVIVDYAVNFFKQNPTADMVNLDPADDNTYSQSPETLKLGTTSNRIFGMANEAAKAVEKAFPGQHKMVGLLSYNMYYDPPSFKMEPNVHIQLSSIGVNPKYSSEERLKSWAQRSHNLGVYEYYSVFAWSQDKLLGSYVNGVRGYQQHVRDDLVAHNIISISAESTSSWGSNGRGYYVANKLLWNPNLDLNALLNDFYDKAFGPAAGAMKKYYEDLSPDNDPLLSGSLLGVAFRDMNEATEAAKDRPDVMARLDQLKLYLRYEDLMWRKYNDGQNIDNNLIMSNLFRTRDYALTSWEMIRQQWGGGKYPGQPDSPVWMKDDKPYTHEEIEADFQDGLKYYEPRIRNVLPRLKYSTDLVLVKWPELPTEVEKTDLSQTYQGSMRYALYSLHGDPLEFTTEAGDAWGYKTSWTVTDASGKVLDEGKPAAKEVVIHKIAVPAPGLYYLNYNDPGAYWTFTTNPNTPATIVVLPDSYNGRNARAMGQSYFYVPKGTKVLQYFATSTHWLYGPDGSKQQRVQQGNDYVTTTIPKGMDGKIWSFGDMTLGKIYFANAPSYLSASPNMLLVPREVAEKDGLEILK